MRRIVINSILIVSLLQFFISCSNKEVSLKQIKNEFETGNFTVADSLIDKYIAEKNPDKKTADSLLFQKDVMWRIRMDFRKNKNDVVSYIKKYYPNVNDEMLEKWEKSKALEVMTIDGEKKYFNRAASNLFLIDKEAKAKKAETDSIKTDDLHTFLEKHLPGIIAQADSSQTHQSKPVKMKVTYTVRVNKNVTEPGSMIRCWLPYPRVDNRRQTDVSIISANTDDILISPDKYKHKTIYLEKPQIKDSATVFSISFNLTTRGEWFDLKPEDIKPYDKESALYKEYTAERKTHVVFSDLIKKYSKEIVGDETNPLLISNKILQFIKDNYPWASAREYSTIANIPEYVIENHHGDCGMVGLLYITLCRYNGIPAKWQSGFMLHPGNLNLHDWAETYFEGIGWVPVDPSFIRHDYKDEKLNSFYAHGIDEYRWIVNDDYSAELYPAKIFPRSETVDFQRGEIETYKRNLYFDEWKWNIDVEYLEN